MARLKPWRARVFKDAGEWRWDVALFGMRSTGGRGSWREAYDTALAELTEIRRSQGEGVAPGGL